MTAIWKNMTAEMRRSPSGRAAHIDAMRGLALLGVIMMNVGAMVMIFNGRQVFATASTGDLASAAFTLVFVLGKARSCFAFLFGAGFAVLMLRAEREGPGFATFYLRRMLVLLLFGLFNQAFLFFGDILVSYALLGMVLILFARWTAEAQLRAGLVLVLAPPFLHGLLEAVTGMKLPSIIETSSAAESARGLAAFTSPSYLDAILQNLHMGSTRHAADTAHMAVYDLSIFGLFLLGSWSVRSGVLLDPQSHRRLLRRIACWSLPVGLILSTVNAGPFLGLEAEGLARAGVTASYVGVPIFAFFYLAAFALLFSRGASRLRSFLAPAGRMSLTNYLVSGGLGCWIFYGYGLGLMREVNFLEMNLLAILIFTGLALFSRMWLSHLAYGPAEWLWRKLSHGRGVLGAAHPATLI